MGEALTKAEIQRQLVEGVLAARGRADGPSVPSVRDKLSDATMSATELGAVLSTGLRQIDDLVIDLACSDPWRNSPQYFAIRDSLDQVVQALSGPLSSLAARDGRRDR